MAVQSGTKSNNTKQQQQQQKQAETGFAAKPTFMPNFGLQSAVGSYGHGGEVYEKLFELLSKKVKEVSETTKDVTYNVIKLLKHQHGLNYSGIILTEQLGEHVSGHVLIVERTGDAPNQLSDTINGVRYEIVRTPSEALDDRYITQATLAVSEALGVEATKVSIVDGTLVPNEFDVNSESLVDELRRNAANAVTSENQIRVKDYKGFNIAELLTESQNGKFFITTYFNGDKTQYFDQTGMPVRQDVCVVLTFKTGAGNSNNRSVNQGDDTFEIVRTYGYVDFEWLGAPQVAMGMPNTQKFVPNFIITHIDSQVAPTPNIVALAVASVTTLREDMSWLQNFRATPAVKGEIDLNDIGALNIEGNIENSPTGFGKQYDTKNKAFTLAELNTLAQTLTNPSMIVSIDVPKAGPETWFTSVFSYIQNGDVNAYNRVMGSVNYMSNGNFVDAGIPVFTDNVNKIHGGYYRTKNGFEDIRHLTSYLSVANYVNATNQSPVLITQYTNTLYNRSIPADLRAAERKKTIDDMAGGSAVYKQTYDRLVFNGKWLSHLVTSLRTAGFAPMPTNMGVSNDMFMRRATADVGSAFLDSNVRLMGTNNAFGNYQGFNQFYRSW